MLPIRNSEALANQAPSYIYVLLSTNSFLWCLLRTLDTYLVTTVMSYLHTGGEDYFLPSESPGIAPSSHTQCISIPIADDNLVERAEVFGFSLQLPSDSSGNIQLRGEGDVTEVVIYDNDGMKTYFELFLFFL